MKVDPKPEPKLEPVDYVKLMDEAFAQPMTRGSEESNASYNKFLKGMTVQAFQDEGAMGGIPAVDCPPGQCEFANEDDFDGSHFIGTRALPMQDPHGIVQLILAGGDIEESQYLHGVKHGFYRYVNSDGSYMTGFHQNDS